MNNVTIGADPEFFLRQAWHPEKESYKKESDRIIPACGLIGGTKEVPIPIPGLPDGFTMQEDGIAAEFNIPPAHSTKEFSSSIYKAWGSIMHMLSEKAIFYARINNLELKQEWITKFPHITQIGCDPDFDAYEVEAGKPEARVCNPVNVGLVRGAGGHIHIGYDTHICPEENLAKLLDLAVALPTLQYDRQGNRRKWWGLPGLYRKKSYGLEYRTLSNWWIWEGAYSRWVAGLVFSLLDSLEKHTISWHAFYYNVNWAKVKNIIVMEDMVEATIMVDKLKKDFSIYEEVLQQGSKAIKENLLPEG